MGREQPLVSSPEVLQARGVNVFFAPNIRPDQKVVNLSNGQISPFRADEDSPTTGYYTDFDGLVRFCRQTGLPLIETDGQVSILPAGTSDAGDPLRHQSQ